MDIPDKAVQCLAQASAQSNTEAKHGGTKVRQS